MSRHREAGVELRDLSLGWRGVGSLDIVARCVKLATAGAVYVFHVGRGSQDAIALPRVIRGLRLSAEFQLYEGSNLIGRRDDRPVDVDVSDLEPPDRIWASRHHAMITVNNGLMIIEDLNSMNGTFVNRQRVYPGHKRSLVINDVVQIGTIQFKVTT